jgi:hypothetical protein
VSAFGEIHARIGTEIPHRRLRSLLKQLVDEQLVKKTGTLKGTRYALVDPDFLTPPTPNPISGGQ